MSRGIDACSLNLVVNLDLPPVSQSVSQPVSQSVRQSVSQPVSQPVRQTDSQALSQPLSQSVGERCEYCESGRHGSASRGIGDGGMYVHSLTHSLARLQLLPSQSLID
eukprot:GHVU01203327.1.p1 GENE.GHVU01203327.1~~GHVU01203327.1.p1  ORF type:complete len:108 (-),score=4.46 GHVU01203327.1:77-400(-)